MDDVPAEIGQLLLVDPGGVAQDIPLFRRQQDVFVHGLVHLVDGVLAVLHDVDVPKACGAVLFLEQHVEHKGIPAVVVEAPLRQPGVVFAGVQHHPVAELAVVDQLPAAGARLFVVPVHHHALVGGVDRVVVDVPRRVDGAPGAAPQLGPAGGQLFRVLQAQAEKVGAVLDVHDPRLPVQHQQVHRADGDLPQPAPGGGVPEDALDPRPLLELAPPAVRIHLFVVGLLQHHRQDARQGAGRGLVVGRPGQHAGLGIVVHGVGVLAGDRVEQPPAGRLGLALHHPVLVLFPVRHPEPQLVVDQPPVQRGLAGLVLVQDALRLRGLFRPHRGRRLGQKFLFHRFHLIFCKMSPGPSPSAPGRGGRRRGAAGRGAPAG